MDLFKFNYTTDPTNVERGEAINGYTSVLWVERYLDPGEFEIVSQLSSGLRDFLPVGTLVGKVDSYEIMIVENHEIGEKTEEDPTLTITGRTLDSWLENRIIGVGLARTGSTLAEYILAADYACNQAAKAINDHAITAANAGDNLANVNVYVNPGSTGSAPIARSINRGTLLQAVHDLLIIDDFGLKVQRKNNFGVGSSASTRFVIYKGPDKSATVHFSWKSGDLDSAQYLFSNKKVKNSAMVLGRYVWTMVDLGPTKYDRRIMIVDASDLDGNLSAPPSGAALTTLLGKMTTRGQQMLRRQTQVTISQADISKTTKYQYRRDFSVGDMITLDGNFGQIAKTRITEYAEIEDENGDSGHPTLSLPGA